MRIYDATGGNAYVWLKKEALLFPDYKSLMLFYPWLTTRILWLTKGLSEAQTSEKSTNEHKWALSGASNDSIENVSRILGIKLDHPQFNCYNFLLRLLRHLLATFKTNFFIQIW